VVLKVFLSSSDLQGDENFLLRIWIRNQCFYLVKAHFVRVADHNPDPYSYELVHVDLDPNLGDIINSIIKGHLKPLKYDFSSFLPCSHN